MGLDYILASRLVLWAVNILSITIHPPGGLPPPVTAGRRPNERPSITLCYSQLHSGLAMTSITFARLSITWVA
jgi:hypothetical protein